MYDNKSGLDFVVGHLLYNWSCLLFFVKPRWNTHTSVKLSVMN